MVKQSDILLLGMGILVISSMKRQQKTSIEELIKGPQIIPGMRGTIPPMFDEIMFELQQKIDFVVNKENTGINTISIIVREGDQLIANQVFTKYGYSNFQSVSNQPKEGLRIQRYSDKLTRIEGSLVIK